MNISTFFGLNVGMSALDTMQQAEDVVSNNIANANTTGYVRETASISEQAPFPSVPANDSPLLHGQLGQGSEVASVTRQTNAFINEQDRANQGTLQMFQTHSQNLTQIESILNEPSSMSMQNAVDQFFASWQTLSTDPSNTAARQAVISQAQTVGQTFQTITTQLEQMQSNLTSTISGQVDQINSAAKQINDLNAQITSTVKAGQNPNQLLDQRGNLLDQLSQLANISYSPDNTNPNQVNVSIVDSAGNSHPLVPSPNSVGSTWNPPMSDTVTIPTSTVSLPASGSPATIQTITSGSIAANSQSVNDIQGILKNINSFVTNLSSAVNTASGVTFFTPTTDTAGNQILQVASSITPNTMMTTSSSGNNSSALAVANLQTTDTPTFSYSYTSLASGQLVSNSYTGTFDQSLAQVVSSLGTKTAQVNAQEQTANSLAQQSSNLRQSISGVNINQEAANMVEYQNVYNAAAKFITVYNSMLQTLIGIVP